MEGLQELSNALSDGTIPDPLHVPSPRMRSATPTQKFQSKIAGK